MVEVMSLRAVIASLSTVVECVEEHNTRIVATRYGKPVLAIVSLADLQQLTGVTLTTSMPTAWEKRAQDNER